MTPAAPTVASVAIVGSAWFWGARLLAGALVSWGVPVSLGEGLVWAGAVAAGWVLSEIAGAEWRDGWRLLPAAALVALPEAVATAADRVAKATALGLRVDVVTVASAVLLRVVMVALLLAAIAGVLAWLRRVRLTSAARRSPT